MTDANRSSGPADPVVLLEAGLCVLLVVFFVFLYLLPTEQRLSGVPWYSPLILGTLSLAILLVDVVRRKRRYRRRTRTVLDDDLSGRR